MVRKERAMHRFWPSVMLRSKTSPSVFSSSADLSPRADPEAPQVNLPHVDTQLNMHQFTSFFDDGNAAADGQADSHSSPTQPPNPSASPKPPSAEAPTEWSAVGHAATGKSGRVIHHLQEEIARLTRECSLYRSRAEETQRSNEALKIQVQNINERLRNLEQVNETNLNSIARKDRKMDELRAELQSERTKRQEAEADTSKTNETMREERENHNREQARVQEISKQRETQYEVLASATKREKADLGRRVKTLWDKVEAMAETQKSHDFHSERLDVIAEQKNREIEVLKETNEKLLVKHGDYKKTKDGEFRDTLERARRNNAMIDTAIASLKETEAEMKWAIQLSQNRAKS